MDYLPCVEVEPAAPANAAVIWLHGLGANGHDFEPVVPHLHLPAELKVRFVFPHAPSIPVTINGGYVMPAWYDILEMNFERKIDEVQILKSAQGIQALIDREITRGIPANRIVLAGFSQGGAVAYQAGLTYPKNLAGIMLMSTYFATHRTIQPHDANRQVPIVVFHGSADTVVPEALGRQGFTLLQGMGYRPEYKTYPMEHEVSMNQIRDISAWLQVRLR